MSEIFTIGSVNVDYTIRGERAPDLGEDLPGTEYRTLCGGKAANHAVGSSRLGARSAIIACAGLDEAGDLVERTLKQEQVDTRFLFRTSAAPTGRVLLHVDSRGKSQSMNIRGANDHLRLEDGAVFDAISRARVIVMQPLQSSELTMSILDAAADSAVLILDPAPPDLVDQELLPRFHLIKPNDNEAEILTGIRPGGEESAREAAAVLQELGAAAVVIGARDGNLFSWQHETLWLPHLAVEPVDETGAGDAITAALAVGSLEGMARRDRAKFAHAAAAVSIRRLGGQSSLGRRVEVDEMAATAQI